MLVGFAVGGSNVSFAVPDRATSGSVESGHLGLYGLAKFGPAYFATTLGFGHFINDTTRTVSGVGRTETVKGHFTSEQITGGFETGWRQSFGNVAATPFVSVQYIDTFQKAYDETSVALGGGADTLGLQIGNRTGTSVPLTAGLRVDARVHLGNGMVWTPYGMVAWLHELSPERGINAALISLPNNPFVVPSALADDDTVRLKAGSKLAFSDRVSAFFDIDAQLSGRTQSYAYKGGFNWILDRKQFKARNTQAPKFVNTVTAEAHLSSWNGTRGFPASQSPAAGGGYQFYETLTGATTGVFTNDLKLELQARTGYVTSKQTTPGLSGGVSTPTDSVVSGTITYSGFTGFAPFFSLNLNLPTGRSVLKGDAAFARMDADFVDLSTFGEGFNQGATVGSNFFLSDAWTLSVSGGYTHRGSYDREAPVASDGSQGTQRLSPGQSASATVGLNYRAGSLFALVSATYTHDAGTFLNGAPSFQAGDRVLASTVLVNSWADTSRTSANGFITFGQKNEILDPTLVILSPEAANSNSKLFRIQVDHTFVKGQWEYGPTISYLRRYENSFSPITRLNDFWGGKSLSAVTGSSCRQYVKHRGSAGGARRDLEDLRAAINHHAKEGFHRGLVRVVLPAKGPARDQWLSRKQAAELLWACWRTREMQTTGRGPDKGNKVDTDRYPLRHISRFILIALYTGTRPGAVLTSSPVRGEGRSFADLELGIFFRLAMGKNATNKRQPPVPLPSRLLAHMRRWARQGLVKEYFVEWNGKPVQSIKVGFKRALSLAGIKGKVTPHTLRHTAATWLMQAGVPIWETAGFLGMSPDMVEHIYGHHHPDHMRGAAEAIGRHGRTNHSLVVSLARVKSAKGKT